MKMTFLLLCIILLFGNFCFAQLDKANAEKFFKSRFKKLWKTDDTFYMTFISVDDSRVYIADKKHCRVCIYSKEDGKKLAEFGRVGDGPGEIKGWVRDMLVVKDKLYICSPGRLGIYSTDGKFIGQLAVSVAYQALYPSDDFFVGKRLKYYHEDPEKITQAFYLLDRELKSKKELFSVDYRIPMPASRGKKIEIYHPHRRKGVLYKDKFYIGCTDRGFYFEVFDKTGKKLYTIDKEYKKARVTERMKSKVLAINKKMAKEHFSDYFKRVQMVFPEYNPAFLNFFIGNDKIYVFHYPDPGANGWQQLSLLDLNGNLLSKKWIYMDSMYGKVELESYSCFNNGKLYFTIDSEEYTNFIEFDVEAALKTDY